MTRLIVCVALAAACTGSKPDKPVTKQVITLRDAALETLRSQLGSALEDSNSRLSGDALRVAPDVRALVEKEPRAWWETLTPVENFFLFEISPAVAARAPADVRAKAFCAGLQNTVAEWWSVPGSRVSENTRRILESKTPVQSCLVELFDDTGRLVYTEGETRLESKQLEWTTGDLAAGIVALLLGEKYDAYASPDARAARRAELRGKIR